jgi:hypothetical protein
MGLLFHRPIRYIDLLYNIPFMNLQPFFDVLNLMGGIMLLNP